jgi:hypothetical protein
LNKENVSPGQAAALAARRHTSKRLSIVLSRQCRTQGRLLLANKFKTNVFDKPLGIRRK